MTKIIPFEVHTIINDAIDAAAAATQNYLNENSSCFPCGFAWVSIKPARGPFVKALKEMKLGSTDSYEGGFTVWNPSQNATQSMYAKIEGAKAFAAHLRANGINATVRSRVD